MVRQSSPDVASSVCESAPYCVQEGPFFVALSASVHLSWGAGGFQRRAPVGGAAYGMPRKARVDPRSAPSTAPLSVSTVRGADPPVAPVAPVPPVPPVAPPAPPPPVPASPAVPVGLTSGDPHAATSRPVTTLQKKSPAIRGLRKISMKHLEVVIEATSISCAADRRSG